MKQAVRGVTVIHRQQQKQRRKVALTVLAVAGKDLETTIRSVVRAAMQHHREDSLLASAIDHEEARLPIAAELDGYLNQGGEMIRILLAHHSAEIGRANPDQAVTTLPALVRTVVDAWANRQPPLLDLFHFD